LSGSVATITRGNPPGLKNVRASVYNHFVRVDLPRSLIFVSGQLARDADGRQVGVGDMLEQTRQCIRNIEKSLIAAGASLTDIVSTTVYTTDMRQFKEIVAAREEFFKDHLPTSTMVEVNHLAEPGLLVEIQVGAAL
jgi:2-iminobutanoate/2-iminopropanoate deaminase